ncbi:hypothetical protein HY375_02445 [Candidatus Berkelbacteria bacterium]|nr:hypothetical protein [Candidatus Berkelbacteria bacterium]
MQLPSFSVVRWVIAGVVILGIAMTVWVMPRLLADRSTPVATVEPTSLSGTGENPPLLNAPAGVQDCVKSQLGEVAFQEIATKARVMEPAEEEILNGCFRDVLAPADEQSVESTPAPATTTKTPAAAQTATSSSQPAQSTDSSSPSNDTGDPGAPAGSGAATTPPPPKEKSPTDDIFAEVWTKNGYDGASYEYKVNCGSNYATLQECFLWDLTRVTVTAPNGTVYDLAKDFNVNSYSGEITRRWVLYGPAGGGLPVAGSYTFTYSKGESVAHTASLNYSPEVVAPPTGITYERTGNDITIRWQAPTGISNTMWYKPSIDPPGNDRAIINKVSAWNETSATLTDVPVSAGEQVEINVAVFFPGGYAYPPPIKATW